MYNSSLFLLVLAGCGGSQTTGAKASTNAASGAETTERITEGGLTLVEVDLNGDGRPEIYNYYRERSQAERLLVRREADLNQDGRIDIWSFYDEGGGVSQERMDGDFDGTPDWVDYYQGGKRTLSEVDTNSDGQFDLFKYYVDGKLVRKERDTNSNGKIDFWELYEDGKVVKAGRDTSGDGNIDVKIER
jgi:hypothetical protein